MPNSPKNGAAVEAVEKTVAEFNAACRPGKFHPTELDGLATVGLEPAKTNWARPLDTPPYYGYSLRPGVTFTYLGLKVDDTARVSGANGRYANVWAPAKSWPARSSGRAISPVSA